MFVCAGKYLFIYLFLEFGSYIVSGKQGKGLVACPILGRQRIGPHPVASFLIS